MVSARGGRGRYRSPGGPERVPDGDHLKLANVAVHPSCRDIGLGRTLIDQAEAEALCLR